MIDDRPTALSITDIRLGSTILEAIAADRSLLAGLSEAERIKLLKAAGMVARPDSSDRRRLARATRRQLKTTARESDRDARGTAEIRSTRAQDVFVAPAFALSLQDDTAAHGGAALHRARHCYVCKTSYTKVHFFYDSMCTTCANFNYAKRFQTAPLGGRTALITGGRLKIGYQAALMLLRAGARVVVTTRFPYDAAERYAQEADYAVWRDRLMIHGLDLRHAPSVELFARYMCQTLPGLDFLINNAAQTVRRPPGFYAHLTELEGRPFAALAPQVTHLLRSHEELKTRLSVRDVLKVPTAAVTINGETLYHDGAPGIGVRASALLSQLPYAYDESELPAAVFPQGQLDQDLQQVDLRRVNSWRLTLAEVATPEMVEVQLVNAVAPFILCAKLKPLMVKGSSPDKHIVNVSAMEGKFSRHTKTDKHPHTNMAKAALNMMTLTSAPDYLRDGIHMNAVDTGWVTDEDPVQHVHRKQEECDFHPPLDSVDGAARIVDPIFSGMNTGVHVHGKFLKDFSPTDW